MGYAETLQYTEQTNLTCKGCGGKLWADSFKGMFLKCEKCGLIRTR